MATSPPARVRTPTILQMEAAECGAAALGIVLAYHGRVVPLEELRAACGVSRDGSNPANILKAARTYGLEASECQLEPDDLAKQPPPAIVFWNFNHFLVVEGHGPKRWYLNDPATGPRVVSAQEFSDSFTGLTLIFQKTAAFRTGGARPGLLRALWQRCGGAGEDLLFLLLAGLALVVPGLIIPTFAKIFVDDVLVAGNEGWVRPLLLGMGLTALLRLGLTYVRQSRLLGLEARVSVRGSADFFAHVLRLPMEFFAQRYPAEVAGRFYLNYFLGRALAGEMPTALLNLLTVGFFALLMLLYDVWLTALVVGLALLNLLCLRAVSRRRRDLHLRLLAEEGKLAGVTMGGLQSIESLKASGGESDFFSVWAGHKTRAANAQLELGFTTLFLSVVPALLTGLNTMSVLALGGLRVMQGEMTIGDLVAFQSLAVSFQEPISSLLSVGQSLGEVEGIVTRLNDVQNYPEDPAIAGPIQALALGAPVKLTGALELRNVTFGYNRLEAPLIQDFSLTLGPGSRVALVGGSGSGKSTISRLITGLYQPWSGEILYDGRPRSAVPRATLAGSLALVDQEIVLFEGTVRENLTLWDATVAEPDVVQAGKDAAIHDVINGRPGGYDSKVEEAGANFSGGQRQRLEIARALCGKPSLLVLDEATASLDAVTERIIDGHLRRRGCTCVIIAHRLSTIRDCDEIIVLERGRVVQRGTHQQLSAVPGAYRELISAY